MSSSGFSPSLVIDRPGCRRAQALILCSMLLALAALGRGGLSGPLQAIAVALVVGGGLRALWTASPGSPRYVTRLLVTADGRFLLGLARDPESLLPVMLVNAWTLPGLATGLSFAGDDPRRSGVILFRDRMPPDAWRRLAVCLLHGRGAAG